MTRKEFIKRLIRGFVIIFVGIPVTVLYGSVLAGISLIIFASIISGENLESVSAGAWLFGLVCFLGTFGIIGAWIGLLFQDYFEKHNGKMNKITAGLIFSGVLSVTLMQGMLFYPAIRNYILFKIRPPALPDWDSFQWDAVIAINVIPTLIAIYGFYLALKIEKFQINRRS